LSDLNHWRGGCDGVDLYADGAEGSGQKDQEVVIVQFRGFISGALAVSPEVARGRSELALR
jgi:hypothetical protein